MKIYKAYKFRMYPDKDTSIKINSFIGSSRFIYNCFLERKEDRYKQGLSYDIRDMKEDVKVYTESYPWLKEVDSIALRNAIEDLDNAYTNFFKGRANHPKFKKKSINDKYKTDCIRSSYKDKNYSNIKVDIDVHTIKLPKLPLIKIKGYRNLKTFEDKKIINATISRVSNRYYVSVCVEEDIPYNEYILNYAVGIDLGIKDLVVKSDGIKYKAMQNIDKLEQKLKGLNRWLSRSQKGSKNREKIQSKIQRVNLKIRNIRKFYTHLITNEIINDYDLIVTESLDTKCMIETSSNKSLTKKIINSTFSEILRQLKYKTKWKNKKLIQIDKYYPSSQICHRCDYQNKKVKDLSIREWVCPKCGIENDRDINASINILWEGITKYYKEQYSN